jgi:hypothetical protein
MSAQEQDYFRPQRHHLRADDTGEKVAGLIRGILAVPGPPRRLGRWRKSAVFRLIAWRGI